MRRRVAAGTSKEMENHPGCPVPFTYSNSNTGQRFRTACCFFICFLFIYVVCGIDLVHERHHFDCVDFCSVMQAAENSSAASREVLAAVRTPASNVADLFFGLPLLFFY